MMKHFFTILIVLVFSATSYADTWYEGTLVYTNGKPKNGLIENTLGSDFVLFKASKDAKEEKIDASTLKAVILKVGEKKMEYHLLKVYLGWGQKKISKDPSWIEVVEKGIATLYVIKSSMSSQDGLNKAGFLDYYIIRDGEPAAKMIANVSSLNNNQTFKAKAPLYFEDYPELAAKIKSKEYTWKDLTTVVQEYNKWAAKKKK
jgi:hypothetical protein